MTREPIVVTDAAVARIASSLDERGEGAIGIGVGGRNAGCPGVAYAIGYAAERNASYEVVEEKGVTILVDREVATFLSGREKDTVEDKLDSGFVFIAPHEKGRCGCGESFCV